MSVSAVTSAHSVRHSRPFAPHATPRPHPHAMASQLFHLLRLLRLLLLLFQALSLLGPAAASIASSTVNYRSQEEQPPGILVGNIAQDGKLPPNRRFTFKLRKASPYFQLNSRSGELRTRTRIDLESICRKRRPDCDTLKLIANAYEPNSIMNVLKAYVNVAVKITDKNDHAPVFRLPADIRGHGQKKYYQKELTERISTPQSTKVELPRAIDGDYSEPFNRLTYTLVGFSDTFNLENNQRPVLRLLKNLDREVKANYTFKVQAQDSEGKRGELEVRIIVKDMDDNPAVFPQSLYRVQIPENTPRDSIIYNVSARDPDEHPLTYKMDPLTADGEEDQVIKSLFQVEPNGEIRLIGRLDYEVSTEYTIVVRADTANFASSTRVIIGVQDMNDNKPTFMLNPTDLRVVENRPSHDPIGDVTINDADSGANGEVTCYEEDPNAKIRFKPKRVEYNGDGYSKPIKSIRKYDIKPEEAFDREVTPRIHARLICTDSGSPPLSSTLEAIIEVVDVNDNRPIFRQSRYYKEIKENNNKNAFILQVNATDEDKGENARISYSLPHEGDAAAFRIDKRTGRIIATQILDRERKDQYVFKVIARDHGLSNPLSSTTEVVIRVLDTNDHKPELIGRTHFNISENRPPNTFIANLKARDPDLGHNGEVSFRKDKQLAHKYFILKRNGSLYSSGIFDRERAGDPKNLCISVLMVDQARHYPQTGRATICVRILDVNDNAPHFTYPSNNASIFITVNAPRGKLIANVRAVDPDEGPNAEVRYVLGNNLDGLFVIGERSGDLRLASTRPLMPEDIRVHKITVTAWDSGSTPLSNSLVLRIVVSQSTGSEFGGFMSGRRNVIIVIILSSVSGVLALVLITAIICMVRPCRIRSSRRRDYAATVDSYAAAKPGWCSPLDEMRLHGQNEYSGTTSPAMSDQPLSLCVDSARPDTTLFKHSLTCPRNTSLDSGQKVCLKHMDTLRTARPYETLDRTKPLPVMGRPVDGDGQQSDSGRGASDEDLSASNHHHHGTLGPALQTFHPGCPAAAGTLRTRHLGPLAPRPLRQPPADAPAAVRPGSAMGHGPEGYESLRRQGQGLAGGGEAPAAPPTCAGVGGGGRAPGGGGGRVDAEQLVEEIDQLFFKDMML